MSRPAALWQDTLVNLQAIGTDDGVVVGQGALVTGATPGVYVCATAAASTSTWTIIASTVITPSGLPAELAVDNTTGTNDIIIDDGQSIEAGAVGPLTLDTAAKGTEFAGNVDITSGTLDVGGAATLDANLSMGATSAAITMGDSLGSPSININKGPAGFGRIFFKSSGFNTWTIVVDSAENFEIARYDTGGSFIDNPIAIDQAAGNVVIANDISAVDATFSGPVLVAGAALTDGPTSARNLVVGDGAGDRGITIFSSATTDGRLVFADTAGVETAGIRYEHNNTQMVFRVDGADEIVMNPTQFKPAVDNGLSLGSGSSAWSSLFVGSISAASAVISANVDITGGNVDVQSGTLDVGGLVTCDADLTAVGDIDGKLLHYEHSNWFASSGTGLVYVPMFGTDEDTDIELITMSIVAPHDGTLVAVEVVGETRGGGSTPGSTIIGFHINENPTPTETETVDMDTDSTLFSFPFAASSFSKGNRLSWSFDPTNIPLEIRMTMILRLDTNT